MLAISHVLPQLPFLFHAYDHLSAEEIYTLRMGQKPPQQDGGKPGGQPGPDKGKGTAQNPSSPGEFTDGAADEAERDNAEAQWKIATMNAAEAAKQQGRLPACAARFVKDLLHPKVPWQEVLRQFLTATTKNDYSFAQPNNQPTITPIRRKLSFPFGYHPKRHDSQTCIITC